MEEIIQILLKYSRNSGDYVPDYNFESLAKDIQKYAEAKADQEETVDMWRSVEDALPECEEEEYAVTDGQSFYMAYYGFNHKTKKTEFSSTSDDFDSLHGCGRITHWVNLDDSFSEADQQETIVSGQKYTIVWELLKEARDEADFEGLERVSTGIEVLLELINHRCTKHR